MVLGASSGSGAQGGAMRDVAATSPAIVAAPVWSTAAGAWAPDDEHAAPPAASAAPAATSRPAAAPAEHAAATHHPEAAHHAASTPCPTAAVHHSGHDTGHDGGHDGGDE
jgi:hypothetical protein